MLTPPPQEYMARVLQQCQTGEVFYGAISEIESLKANLATNCLPLEIEAYAADNFDQFLEQRRKLMAEKIKRYYLAL